MGEKQGHTRGPWEVRFARNGYPYSIEAPNGNRGPGGITSVTRWGAISFPSSQEGLANARLIAAAPDLLEAADHIDRTATDIADDMVMISGSAYRLMRAAIAKATGDTDAQ